MQKIIKSPKLSVDVHFTDDATESRICNDRLLFLYARSEVTAHSLPRKKRALLLENSDDEHGTDDTGRVCSETERVF